MRTHFLAALYACSVLGASAQPNMSKLPETFFAEKILAHCAREAAQRMATVPVQPSYSVRLADGTMARLTPDEFVVALLNECTIRQWEVVRKGPKRSI